MFEPLIIIVAAYYEYAGQHIYALSTRKLREAHP
jgi:hypothetical protein